MPRDVHRIIVPTLWGYATLVRTRDSSPPSGGTTRRIDTVLPPELSPDEITEFHARLLLRPAARRRPGLSAATAGCRRMLSRAVDVRTTAALTADLGGADLTALDVACAALVRAMRRADGAGLTCTQEALARQLVWCALHAAPEHRLAQVLHAAAALRGLAASAPTGTAPTDALDQA